MEISTVTCPSAAPVLPPCLAPSSSAQPADSSLTEKEPAQEGEFAALLASLQKPAADKAAGETCTGVAGQLVTADTGGEAWSGSGNAPAGHYEIACLPGTLGAGKLSLVPAGEKPAIVSDAPGSVEPAPATQNALNEVMKTVPLPWSVEPAPATQNAKDDVMKTVPLPGEVTAAGTEHDGLKGVIERQPQSDGGNAEQGAVKMTPAAAQPFPGTAAEGKPAGGPEQEVVEATLAESSTQPSVRPVLTPAEPAQAEAVRRLQAVKSAVLEQVLEKMVFSRSESGETKVFVRLKPPALGEVEISLYLEDGRLTGRIVAENAMVRDLLDASLTQLRQRLEAQQLQVAELTVSIGQEKEFHRGRDSREGETRRSGGREKTVENANPALVILPGLLNALA